MLFFLTIQLAIYITALLSDFPRILELFINDLFASVFFTPRKTISIRGRIGDTILSKGRTGLQYIAGGANNFRPRKVKR